jgi:hypothetical protein
MYSTDMASNFLCFMTSTSLAITTIICVTTLAQGIIVQWTSSIMNILKPYRQAGLSLLNSILTN